MLANLVLPEPDRDALLFWSEQRDFSAGELLLRVGDQGDRIYVMLQGRISVERSPETGKPGFTEERGPGELAGMLAFFTGADNDCTVRSVSGCRCACISRASFDALLTEQPALWRKLEEIGLLRMRKMQLANHLDRLFGPFGVMLPHVLKALEEDTRWLTLKSGETLFEQGSRCEGVYVLMTGRLQLANVQVDGRETLQGSVVAGETVGEIALLTGQPQEHTVFAARDSELVRLSTHSFELMLQRNTRAIHNVSTILGGRLSQGRERRDPSRAPIRCIGLIPASPDVQLAAFADDLEAQLRCYGSTLHLSSHSVGRELDAPTIAQADEKEAAGLRLTQWLCEQEEEWRYLVYQADADWNAWSARCVRQTDQVVVLADATSPTSLQDVAARLSGTRQRWSLVLLHPAGLDRPRNTARWLREVNAESVFHVRRDRPAAVRAARRIWPVWRAF